MSESGKGSPPVENKSELPIYAAELAAFHEAFAAELRAIIDSLPLQSPMRVLDVGCGDGFYTRLLAERLGPASRVVGLDSNAACLDLARCGRLTRAAATGVDFVQGDLRKRPFQCEFDLVWCAQSLYSLPEPVAALASMRSALRPGGFLFVLENDSLHQLLLPWPPEIELAVRRAELLALSSSTRHPARFYVGRRLPALLAAAGLEPLGFRTQCIDRKPPLTPALELFLRAHLKRLAERVQDSLPDHAARELRALVDADGNGSLLRQPHFTLSWLNVLAWGRRPDEG